MKFFTIAELCKSTTADRLGINNRCRQEHVTALTALVDNVLTHMVGKAYNSKQWLSLSGT